MKVDADFEDASAHDGRREILDARPTGSADLSVDLILPRIEHPAIGTLSRGGSE